MNALLELHKQIGGTFGAAGDGPAHYGDVPAEYAHAHRRAAIFDRSRRGRIALAGNDRIDLLHRLTTNDIKALTAGQGQPNVLLSKKGRVVEQFDVLLRDADILLALASGRATELVESIERFVFIEQVEVEDLTSTTFELLLAGPQRMQILADAGVTGDLQPNGERDHVGVRIDDAEVLLGVAEPLAGGALRLIGAVDDGSRVFEALRAAGARPAGREVEEILRVEAGLGAPDHELSERFNPLEIGLTSMVSFTKGCFTGQEVVARLHNYDKVQRALCGIELEAEVSESSAGTGGEAGSARETVSIDGAEAGLVTSTVRSPGFDAPIALALIEREQARPGQQITVGSLSGRIVELPFAPPRIPPIDGA